MRAHHKNRTPTAHEPLATSTRTRRLAAGWAPDVATASDARALFELLTPDLADARAARLLEAERACQLVVVAARCQGAAGDPGGGGMGGGFYHSSSSSGSGYALEGGSTSVAPPEMVDAIVKELMRSGGAKLPRRAPQLLADLAAALADLGWRERPLWLALATAAKALAAPPPSAALTDGGGSKSADVDAPRDARGCAFSAEAVAALLGALARAGLRDEELLELLAAAAAAKAPQMSVRDLATAAGALAAFAYRPSATPAGSEEGGGATEALGAALARKLWGGGSLSGGGGADGGAAVESAQENGEGGGAAPAADWWAALGASAADLAAAPLPAAYASAVGAPLDIDDGASAGYADGSSAAPDRVAPTRAEEEAEVDAAISCLLSLAQLGLRGRAPFKALLARLAAGGARLAPRAAAGLLGACAAAGYREPRVLRKAQRAAAALPVGEWRLEDAAAAARALGELRRWDAPAAAALAAAAAAAPAPAPANDGTGDEAEAEAIAAAPLLADAVWGLAASMGGGKAGTGRDPPTPPAAAALCARAAEAALAAAAASAQAESLSAVPGGAAIAAAAAALSPRQQANLAWGLRRLGDAAAAAAVTRAFAAAAAGRRVVLDYDDGDDNGFDGYDEEEDEGAAALGAPPAFD